MSRPVRITTQMVEKNIKFQRDQDVYRQALGDFASENNNLLAASNAQKKVDASRKLNYQQVCMNEAKYERQLKDESQLRRTQQRTLEQNEALATMLDRETAEQQRRELEMQRICDDSPELKELEKALQIAYLNKERATQHMEKVLRENVEKERNQAIEDAMEHDRQMSDKAIKAKQSLEDDAYAETRVILQRQMKEREDMLLEAKHQVEVDRATVDGIIQKIKEEDEAEYRKKREDQAKSGAMAKAYQLEMRAEKERKKQAQRDEEEAIAQYNRNVEARNDGVKAKKQAQEDEKAAALAKIVAETERRRKEEEEFNSLRDMLWEEELEAARNADTLAREEKTRRMRSEMMAANTQIMAQKAILRKEAAENEARMLAVMRKKFAEDDAKERADEQARRAHKAQHMTLIDKQSNERRMMYNREKEAEEESLAEGRRREDYRKAVIAEARRKLLEEHASKLAGYMPGGLLKNKEDVEVWNDVTRK